MADFAAKIQINRGLQSDFWRFITFKQKESAEFFSGTFPEGGGFQKLFLSDVF